MAQRVLEHIRRQELLHAGERLGVAVSGGIDSVALLRLLLEVREELGIVLSVLHFNHRLRGVESDGDEEFVANLARERDLEFYAESNDVSQHAGDKRISLETAARELRYAFFRDLIRHGGSSDYSQELKALSQAAEEGRSNPRLDKVSTGHTLDDQAETVLMRLIRGTGLSGLSGIHPRIAVEDEGEICGEIVRPLLSTRRTELEQYLKEIGQAWREDSTNADHAFTRNRVRRLLVPLLEKEFNPAVTENLAELAEISRGEEDYWDNEIAGWMGTGVHWFEPEWVRSARDAAALIQIGTVKRASSLPSALLSKIEQADWLVMNASIDRRWFLSEPIAVQRRAIKAIGEHGGIPLEFKHVEEIVRFVSEDVSSGKELSLPLGWKVVRHPEDFVFVTPDLREPKPPEDYEYDLSIPGEVQVCEAGSIFEARRIPAGVDEGYNPEQLLDAGILPGPLKVRNWRAGDRFWPNHTKSPKKIKELLHERHIEQQPRKLWPVVVSGSEVIWMRGFAIPAQFLAKSGRDSFLIVEKPLG